MRTHREIDARSLELARAIVARIDADHEEKGLECARNNCDRWLAATYSTADAEWREILARDWEQIGNILLDPGETGQRLHQSTVAAPG